MKAGTNPRLHSTRRKVIYSILIALFTLLANYVIINTSIPLPGELNVLQGWDKFKAINGIYTDSIPNEVMIIDVCYDKKLVSYYRNGELLGNFVITDRQKLLDFLLLAKKANNYKYILLDVFFEKGIKSPQDTALFNTIASMERIVIPSHSDTPLEDSCLIDKSANADYTTTWKETNFARYQFLHGDIPSIPLKMYEDIYNKTITHHGFYYTSDGCLCRNGVTLKLPIRPTVQYEEGYITPLDILNLGSDVLAMDSIAPIAEEIAGKIVVIGDYKNDIHETYAGQLSGSIICLNAYYALVRGDHILLGRYGKTLCFYLLITIVYCMLTIAIMNGVSFSSFVSNPWLKIVLSLVSINAIFWVIAFLAYIVLDIVYNVWIPIGIFSVLDYVINIYKGIKYEKTTVAHCLSAGFTDNDKSRQI